MKPGDLVRFVPNSFIPSQFTGRCGVVTSRFERDEYVLYKVLVDRVVVDFVSSDDVEVIDD